ncbi:MAG: hypothetical protein COW84_05485 [Gammaproteobacteria bacterium CG22_combo_CG10-13_8_21_14_all_40_8]|nr:MAG: hypothetical protein COW84_05485 [Gammaproteobacteria bacterium CG22_combo_CG10-13_8_21_14_all_40_8]
MQYLQQILLMLGIGLLSAGFYYLLSQFKIKLERLSQDYEQLKNQFIVIQSAHIIQGKKLQDTEVELKHMVHLKKNLSLQPKNASKSYEQAAKMLSIGANPNDIMECCQLTKGEIQLLSQLQKSQLEGFVH